MLLYLFLYVGDDFHLPTHHSLHPPTCARDIVSPMVPEALVPPSTNDAFEPVPPPTANAVEPGAPPDVEAAEDIASEPF